MSLESPDVRPAPRLLDRLRRWWRMDGVKHVCQNCGKPMTSRQNDAGLWVVACPSMWVSFSDTYLEHNYSGHSVTRISGEPIWGDCGHEHEVTYPLRGYPV